jgi:hypothetical protein
MCRNGDWKNYQKQYYWVSITSRTIAKKKQKKTRPRSFSISCEKQFAVVFANEHRANLSFVVLLLLPNQKNERVLQPISGSERPDSQANSSRKAGWSFNCPHSIRESISQHPGVKNEQKLTNKIPRILAVALFTKDRLSRLVYNAYISRRYFQLGSRTFLNH